MAGRFSDSSSSDHVQLKIPSGDSPYVMAKHVQLVEKDPNKAIALFWRAINSADRVDSALKDMAVVMKQLDRAEEAIEAIKSFRGLCSIKAQEPLDNVLLDLYKKCGRVTEQIDLLNNKLRMIDEGTAFGGKIMKTARSQGKKFHITTEQEKSRLLGNLAWAYMQCENYREAEPLYRRALEIEKDYNKMCNLAICLIQTGRLAEAEIILADVKRPTNYCNGESYQKSYGRAWEMMKEMELKPDQKAVERNSSVSTPCSIITEKTKAAPSIFDMASPEYEVSPDALTQGSIGASSSQEAFLSPMSVKVTSQCKPVMISEYSVERKNADGGTENLVIALDIQMLRPKGKEFVVNSKKVPPLASNDQSFDRSKASTDAVHKEEDDDGVKFRFESPDLSSGPNADQPLFCKTEKKTWADLVEEDEKLTCEIAEISGSSLNIVGRSWADIAEEEERSDNKSSECGSYGGHQQSTSRTPISSCKKLNRNETLKWTHDNMNSSSLKTGNQKYRSSGYKELCRRWRGTAKNAEQQRRTLSSDRWPGCNFRGGKLVPELIGSGGRSCEDSDYLSGMGGRYSCGKQRNRLQVFQEITPGDAKA